MISTAASVMSDAFSRFDKAGQALLGAVAMGGEGAPEAIGAMIEAKTQFSAGAALIKLSDDMMRELIDAAANERR
jgi:flagellar hook protein FlgE